MVCRKLTLLLLCAFSAAALAQPLPEAGVHPHEGVATCATSVCHGKISPDPQSTVWLNEYRVWLRQDYHSRAYRTLQTAQSKAIAAKLGLPAAHTADICLDCHADNVASESRGRRFQISDGVGCEACHGGAGKWLESHAEEGTLHSDNLAAGMYPTEQPLARAKLCLSCHLGTRDKFATHAIMGAGHPRLSFELETFTANQPAHYEVDADYGQRKPAIGPVNMWLAGLTVSSLEYLELLQSDLYAESGMMPELSFYQCHACHHPMDDLRWQSEFGDRALPPGAVRLNDGNLQVLVTVLESLGRGEAASAYTNLANLHKASMVDKNAVAQSAATLADGLEPVLAIVSQERYSSETQRLLRRDLLQAAKSGDYRHFTSAEQVFMAVETLSIALGEEDKYRAELDALFASVENENSFVPKQFAVLSGKMLGQL
ncbi:MAG: multiheme c-type cytochrome [Halieaceae bacterium]